VATPSTEVRPLWDDLVAASAIIREQCWRANPMRVLDPDGREDHSAGRGQGESYSDVILRLAKG
jgi:hypothetical protein